MTKHLILNAEAAGIVRDKLEEGRTEAQARLDTNKTLYRAYPNHREVAQAQADVDGYDAALRLVDTGMVEQAQPVNQQLVAALKDLVADITERFDMEHRSTNPGMKWAVQQALDALNTAEQGEAK